MLNQDAVPAFKTSMFALEIFSAAKFGNARSAQAQNPAETSVPVPANSAAQKLVPPRPIEIGRRHKIQSKILGGEREYLVYLPSSYADRPYLPQSYPVLYLFDGDVQFHSVTGIVSFMAESGWQIPKMIVVGIPHKNRTKELTPTNTIIDFGVGKPPNCKRIREEVRDSSPSYPNC